MLSYVIIAKKATKTSKQRGANVTIELDNPKEGREQSKTW